MGGPVCPNGHRGEDVRYGDMERWIPSVMACEVCNAVFATGRRGWRKKPVAKLGGSS